ncbi:hypothetical protein [Salmonirosea aquatica]|uniref:Uncharacterized protein n=1 Tax=Salmonirosea aquatica TaxID=2654236 RepID=A0A7C9BJ81_9BACT|nr:hypothetical protein [Cytophagaceae bacterium SJW1-29]
METPQQITSDELRRISGHFQEKYGLAMDSLTAALLNEVKAKGQHNIESQKELADKIMSEIKAVKGAIKPLVTENPWVAFTYGFGKHAWAFTTVVLLGVGLLLHHSRETTKAEYQRAQLVLERYPNLPMLEPLIKSAKIVQKDQGAFLELAPAKDRLLLGRNYTVDPSIRLPESAQKVFVPLSFK